MCLFCSSALYKPTVAMDTFKAMKKVNVFKSYFLFISHCLIWKLRNMLKSMCNAMGKHIQLSHSLQVRFAAAVSRVMMAKRN